MERVQGWERALSAEISRSLARPFAWHENDCCSFAARCVLAVTGQDLFAIYLGSYSNERGAMRVLKAHGGIATICDALLGERGQPLRARRGDLVLVRGAATSDAIAVCVGSHAFMPGPRGLGAKPIGDWLAAWNVG